MDCFNLRVKVGDAGYIKEIRAKNFTEENVCSE